MKSLKKVIAVLLVVAMLFSVVGCGGGSSEPPKQGDSQPGDSTGYTRTEPLKLSFAKLGNDGEFDNQRPAAHYLMDLVTEYSNGMIQFDFYPNGQLGSETDMLDQVISGDLDMAMLSDGSIASVAPEVSMSMLPFLFNSSEEFYAIASLESGSEYQKALVQAMDNYGLFKYVAPMNGLFRAFANRKHPVDSIDDLKDITIRIQPGSIYNDSYAALGQQQQTLLSPNYIPPSSRVPLTAKTFPSHSIMLITFMKLNLTVQNCGCCTRL